MSSESLDRVDDVVGALAAAVSESPVATANRPGWWGVEGSIPLLVVVIVAGIGTGLLFAVSLLAYHRRRSRQYLLISVAVGALWLRSVIGAATVLGYVPMPVHHFIEHSLDFLIAALVLYAVYANAPGTLSGRIDTGSDEIDE
ncbi:hypothetical protein JCM18237_03730 [Halorubrum luteum]